MSNVQEASEPLRCSVCSFRTDSFSGMRSHEIQKHRTISGNTLRDNPGRRKRRLGFTGGPVPPPDVALSGGVPNASARGEPGNVNDNQRLGSDAALQPDFTGRYTGAVNHEIRALLQLSAMLRPLAGGADVDPTGRQDSSFVSVATEVRALYEALQDASRAQPLVTPRARARPGRFDTVRLRALQRFVLSIGAAGMTQREQRLLYDFLETWDGTHVGMEAADRDRTPLRDNFASPTAFVNALRDDIDHAAIEAGWKEVMLTEAGVEYEAFFRSVLDVLASLLLHADVVRWWSGDTGPAPSTDRRESPLDGDAFKECEREVLSMNGPRSCVIGLHAYSDSSQLSWSGAHKLYPLRVKVVNLSGREKWVTVAYVPVVKTLQETAADERGRLRRCGIMQRVLYLAFREAFSASHCGFLMPSLTGLRLFPRILLCVCDQPEEGLVLCLKGGKCKRPCSQCDVKVEVCGAPIALDARGREVVASLERHLETAGYRRRAVHRQRRLTLEAMDSGNSFVPALAGMAGTSTAPYLFYRMVGFDVLHVLDLGVTRDLVHRLVEIYPAMCAGSAPLAGSPAATYRVAFERLFHLGRRSKACKAPPGLLVGKKDKQFVYTGKQQRGGISILPFIVAGLFRSRSAQSTAPAPLGDSGADVAADGQPDLAAAAIRRGDGTVEAEKDGGDESASGYEPDSDEGGASTKKGTQFDWDAYNLV